MSFECKSSAINIGEADHEVLKKITKSVDSILEFCATDVNLRTYALKFQLEQAADKAAYDFAGKDADKVKHMKRVLQRMVDLGFSVAAHILDRTSIDMHKNKSSMLDAIAPSSKLLRNSSVKDFVNGTEAWLESGAHLSYTAVELLASVLVVHSKLRYSIQMYMLEKDVVCYISDALSISQKQELRYFQEGYKTEHMRLVANFCFNNADCSKAIVRDDKLLKEILSATRIDEENPGMVEWAEFAIRNLCELNPEARDRIKKLTPIRLSEDSERLLTGRATYGFSAAGKLCFEPSK